MPLFESEATPRGRVRVFVRAQLPFLLGAGLVALVVATAVPAALANTVIQLGFAIIVVASIAAVALPWERTVPSALIVVAVADLVAVALLRAELLSALPSVGMLAIFPILWLSYGFRRMVVVIAIVGALFITSFGFAYQGAWPRTTLEWANVVTLPALIVGVALVVNAAASQLRRNREHLVISNARQADALRQSQDNELLLRAILDTVSAGIAYYDADNRFVMGNRPAAELVGVVGFRLDQPPYAGDNVLAADRATPIAYDEQIIPRALRGETISDHVEWLGPPDRQIAIMASARQIHRPDGALLGTVIVAYDITQLAQAIAIREEFLTTVSHELRTPLTSVTGYLELLEDSIDPTDTASAGYVSVISRGVEKLRDRIADLLAATDSESALDVGPVEVSSLVDDAVASVASAVERRRQTVAIHRDPQADGWIEGDRARLLHAVSELLANAVKFGAECSSITVTQSSTGGEHTIAIEDSGPGLSRGEQAQMFDRFYRTAHARLGAVQGFGLGLALVKATAERHGGRVSVSSSPGDGTTISLILPAAETARATP
jgi:signal transduction histidine kinase